MRGHAYLQLLLIAGQPEEEVLLLPVYAGLAMHRTVMLLIYFVILLVLLASHTIPACRNGEIPGQSIDWRVWAGSESLSCAYIVLASL